MRWIRYTSAELPLWMLICIQIVYYKFNATIFLNESLTMVGKQPLGTSIAFSSRPSSKPFNAHFAFKTAVLSKLSNQTATNF